MPQVFPRILMGATIEIDCKSETVTENSTQEDYDKSRYAKKTFDLGMFGGLKTLSLNTAALEQKIEAFRSIHNLSEYLGKAFFPYVEQSL